LDLTSGWRYDYFLVKPNQQLPRWKAGEDETGLKLSEAGRIFIGHFIEDVSGGDF